MAVWSKDRVISVFIQRHCANCTFVDFIPAKSECLDLTELHSKEPRDDCVVTYHGRDDRIVETLVIKNCDRAVCEFAKRLDPNSLPLASKVIYNECPKRGWGCEDEFLGFVPYEGPGEIPVPITVRNSPRITRHADTSALPSHYQLPTPVAYQDDAQIATWVL